MTTPKHVRGTIKAEHIETLRKMAEQLCKNAENAERMCELLQPEFDKFEARAEPHNVYVVRDYVDHRNAAKRQRKEAEAILSAIQPDPEPQQISASEFMDFTRPLPDHPYDEQFDHQSEVEDNPCGAWAAIQHMAHHLATPSSAGTVSVEAALPVELTAAQLDDACMSYRHDHGLLTAEQREDRRREAAEWWRCLRKTIAEPPALRALAGEGGR